MILQTLAFIQDAAAPQESRSLLGYINAGGPVSYFLVCLSILAVTLIVTNMVMLRRTSLAPDHVVEGLEPLLAERNVDLVQAFCRAPGNDCFLSRIVSRGLAAVSRSQFGLLELKPAVEEAGARELAKLERVNHGLAMLAAVGPMLGLLGTVLGMIGAFAALSGKTGLAKNNDLASHMSVALVCTAEGLLIAIPCTFAYAMFKRRTERVVSDVGDTAERLLGVMGSGPIKQATPAAAAGNGGAQRHSRTGAA
ncbi:MAG: MotA/TolQ/ExbB proton channel family protein [Phycisphaerales bacterium]